MPVLYLTEQGATLRKDGDLLAVTKEDSVLQHVSALKVEQVVVFGNVNITTPVLHFLLREGIDCVFCSSYGKYHGRLFSTESGFGVLRQRQIQATVDWPTKLAIAREIVRGKLLNQRTIIQRYRRRREGSELDSAISAIGKYLQKLDALSDVDLLLGVEGYGSALYYRAFRMLLTRDMGFVARVRRPPTDPVNSLLSFGYTLLTYGMQAAVHTVGLDPFLGFLHAAKYSRPSLVLDLIEQFRGIVVDSVVLQAVNTGAITDADFEPPSAMTRGVFLNQDGMKKFIDAYEARMHSKVLHPVDGVQVTYRRALELQARYMARVILGQESKYRSFTVR